jgi:hypothetical protein
MGLTELSIFDHYMNDINRREETHIMFHDKITEKVDMSTGPTSFRHPIVPLNSISPQGQRKSQHLIEMSHEMLYVVTDLNTTAFLSERSTTRLNISSCAKIN